MKQTNKVFLAWAIRRKDDVVTPLGCYWKKEDAWKEIDSIATVAPPSDKDTYYKWFGVKELEIK